MTRNAASAPRPRLRDERDYEDLYGAPTAAEIGHCRYHSRHHAMCRECADTPVNDRKKPAS